MPSNYTIELNGRTYTIHRNEDGTFSLPEELKALKGLSTALKPAWEPIVCASKGSTTINLPLFFYVPKASRSEREAGLDNFNFKPYGMNDGANIAIANGDDYDKGQDIELNKIRNIKNRHPTVKPINIMRVLVRATPPNATILDPFSGSGSTGIAAILENRNYIGIEKEEEYVKISEARIAHWEKMHRKTHLSKAEDMF